EEAVGSYAALKLDYACNPVIASSGPTTELNSDVDIAVLLVAHCNDPNCASSHIQSPDLQFDGAQPRSNISLEFDAVGNPVISYEDPNAQSLRLMHCFDANCAGRNISVVTNYGPEEAETSLEMD